MTVVGKYREDESGCWVWTRYTDARGYGRVSRGAQLHQAHRVSYEEFVGPIPDGMEIDHLCRNRSCIRPDHLEPVPHRVNVLRGTSFSAVNAAKTTCPAGHEYDYIRPKDNARMCKTCGKDSKRRARRAAQALEREPAKAVEAKP